MTYSPGINRITVYWLVISLGCVLAPHLQRLPLLASAVIVLLGAWRWWIERRGQPLPHRIVMLLLTFAAIGFVKYHYGTVMGKDSGIALLALLSVTKLLEIRTKRDLLVSVLLNYFLVVTNFLYSQSIIMALYMLLVITLITATLIAANGNDMPAQVKGNLRLSATMILQAAPLGLLLFLLFPRVTGPLWGLPVDAFSNLTGLSDRMSPGRISQLTQSDAIAFRIDFDGPPPPNATRYWRGPVLWLTDGETWYESRQLQNRAEAPKQMSIATPVTYIVTLEPHNKNWLFTLDLPILVPANSRMTADFQLLFNKPVKERIKYKMISYLDYSDKNSLQESERQHALQLPDNNPRTLALGREWRRQSQSDQEVAALALRYFHEQEFIYTLSPPRLGSDPMDQFLFNTRRGFCEHYAASFTLLMRAAGVPARVVTGYQGGEINPIGNYMVVRQRDAHAWAEIWIDKRGWVRVDPTAAVAPERIQMGIDNSFRLPGMPVRFDNSEADALQKAWRSVRNSFDSVNNAWNQWVLGYSESRQKNLFTSLNLANLSATKIAILLGALVGLLLAALGIYMHLQGNKRDQVVKEWERFCRKLAFQGILREPAEGPIDFMRRVSHLRPELLEPVGRITTLYVALRYAEQQPGDALAQLKSQVRTFRISSVSKEPS